MTIGINQNFYYIHSVSLLIELILQVLFYFAQLLDYWLQLSWTFNNLRTLRSLLFWLNQFLQTWAYKVHICALKIGEAYFELPIHPTILVTSVLTWPSVWYEIGVLWAKITHNKSHAIALSFCLQADMK